MKDTVTDANFPRTSEGRVYHLGLKHGDLANRILTVGDPARATGLAQLLQPAPGSSAVVRIESDRGFLTFTGIYKDKPISIVSIGMGFANMDFLVREGRECVDGDMYMIRFGSCGCLTDLPVGSIVAPKASVAVTRNLDFDFGSDSTGGSHLEAYRISKPVAADESLHRILESSLQSTISSAPASSVRVLGDCINASADSFYSSQGRITSFNDHNEGLIDHLLKSVDGLTTLEMETFYLLHLANSWNRFISSSSSSSLTQTTSTNPLPVPETRPPAPNLTRSPSSSSTPLPSDSSSLSSKGLIHAASAQMIFASRLGGGFITPDEVTKTQEWGGRACLDALAAV